MASRALRDTSTTLDGRYVDYGASYFTARDEEFRHVIDRLVDEQVVAEWTDAFHVHEPQGMTGMRMGPVRYRASGGLRSVVATLAQGLDIRLDTPVGEVDVEGSRPHVDGDEFDVVALCMPAPQLRNFALEVPDSVNALVWEPVIAVTVVFNGQVWNDFDGIFVNDDPVLTWIANDGRRRGDGADVFVAHVHPVLSARHLEDPHAVIPAAVATMQKVLNTSTYPEWVDAHRWTYAKPMSALEESCWVAPSGRWGLAGDGFAGGPRVEAAWKSGNSLGRQLVG